MLRGAAEPALVFREQSRGETRADAIIHLLALAAATCGGAVLLALAFVRGGAGMLLSVGPYAACLLGMLGFSFAYNTAARNGHAPILRRCDQAVIFLMIAGTYTPVTLLGLDGAWQTGLIAFIWTAAGLGFLLKLAMPRLIEGVSLGLYLLLGWAGVAAIGPLVQAVQPAILIMLAAGGVLYSLGTIFHVWRKLPYQNPIWHGFVVAAASVHYVAVLMLMMDKTSAL